TMALANTLCHHAYFLCDRVIFAFFTCRHSWGLKPIILAAGGWFNSSKYSGMVALWSVQASVDSRDLIEWYFQG
ncbi:MAG: hypothetical protein P8H52_04040, partial [Porticoccaceae bacterium]|nr:hypothetical protein [Porticoccaceae bacterium]